MAKPILSLVGLKFSITYFNIKNGMNSVDEENEFKWGGKDTTYEKLKQKTIELQLQRIANCKKHELIFIRNIYDGTEPKSEWQCSKCGKIKYKRYYNKRG